MHEIKIVLKNISMGSRRAKIKYKLKGAQIKMRKISPTSPKNLSIITDLIAEGSGIDFRTKRRHENISTNRMVRLGCN